MARSVSGIVVDGVDLHDAYDVFPTGDSSLGMPTVATEYLEVPGRDGPLDMSEALMGHPVYGQRADVFVLYVESWADFYDTVRRLSAFLHGRRRRYTVDCDPGWTREGRFRVASADLAARTITVEVDADTWKRGQHHNETYNCAGGRDVQVSNGSGPETPVITVGRGNVLVSYRGEAWVLEEAGKYEIWDLVLDPGRSTLHINSSIDYCDTTWDELDKKYGTFSSIATRRFEEFCITHGAPSGAQYRVTVEYDEKEF